MGRWKAFGDAAKNILRRAAGQEWNLWAPPPNYFLSLDLLCCVTNRLKIMKDEIKDENLGEGLWKSCINYTFPPFLDDMLIKLWDWDKKWSCSQVFEGHTHYVMQIVINPKDNNQFASASLDRTIKVQ